MSEPTATVVVGGHALAVGGRAGTLIERGAAGDGAPEVAEALGTPRVGTAARAAVDDLSDATGRAETAAGLFRAVVERRIGIADATGFVDEALDLLDRLDRDGRHAEALNLARALNGLLALAMRWVELVRSLRIGLDAARKIGDRAGEAWCQHELGTLELVAGDPVAANRRLSEAQSLRRDLGDVEGLEATRRNLGVLCRGMAGGSRLARRLLAAAAALLLLLAGGAGGAVLASRDDDPGAAVSGAIVHLTVDVDGPGSVESAPAGIDCPDDCERDFTPRTEIVLTPEPDDGATFAGWSGACSGTDPCVLRPRRDRTVGATFREEAAPPPETARLDVDPPDNGRVTSTPEGIECGDDCSQEYRIGQPVTLEAIAEPGFRFTAWGGDCSNAGPCALTMDQDHTVSATFTAEWTITVTVSGEGTVTSEPAGIECTAGTCSATFSAADGQVVLTASDGEFLRWGGDCERAEATCTLALDADHEAVASFSTPGEP